MSCAAGHWGGCLALAPALAGSAAAVGLHMAGAYYFGIPLWYGLLFPAGLYGGGRHGDREPAPAAERSRDLEGPDLFMKEPAVPRAREGPDLPMKEPAPPREPAIRADRERVERMSTWMAILLVVLAALLINQLQWVLLPFAIAGLGA